MDAMSQSNRFYVTGGSLHADTPSYIERRADTELYEALEQGEFCYILTSRQMGKSSLTVRTALRLQAEGVITVVLDLTALGQNVAAEQWYYGLLSRVGERLDLEDALEAFWMSHHSFGPLQRFMAALRQVVLVGCPGRVVLFIDEIDVVRSLPFSTDEFFAAIREFYNRRTEDPTLKRLTFCLLGVAAPTDLIIDTRMTPFNIGRRIELTDFTEGEAAPLAAGLDPQITPVGADSTHDPKAHSQFPKLLHRILHWTGGHPYLTQRLCLAVAQYAEQLAMSSHPYSTHQPTPNPLPYRVRARYPTPSDVDRLCAELFLSHRAQERDDNLIFVRERMLRNEADLISLLELYEKVWRNKPVADDDTNGLIDLLRLSGIARVRNGRLSVRNRIYERVFDRQWFRMHMPDAEVKRLKAAYRRGLVRATSFGTAILVAMAALAVTAVNKATQANDSKNLADTRTMEANALASDLKRANYDLRLALSEKDEKTQIAKSEAERADKEAQQSKTARQGEESQKLAAIAARTRAEARTRESNARLVRLNLATGERLVETGDLFESLLYFTEAMRLDAANTARSTDHRIRIAAVLQQCPRLTHEWFHSSSIRGVAFSSDGQRVLVFGGGAGGPEVARVCDARTGDPLGPQLRHGGPVTAAGFSPDGQTVVTGSDDGTARIWDAAGGASKLLPLKHDGVVNQVEFSRDGHSIFTKSGTRPPVATFDSLERLERATLRTWDATTGKPLHRLALPEGCDVAFPLPDGDRVVVVTGGNKARIWSLQSGKPVTAPFDRGPGGAGMLSCSPDGRRLLTGSLFGPHRVWDTATGKPVTGPGGLLSATNGVAVFSQDGRRIAAGEGNAARVLNADTGAALTPPLQTGSPIRSLAFSPNGRYLAAGGEKGVVRVWDIEKSEAVPSCLHNGSGSSVRFLQFSSEGRHLLSVSADMTTRLWDFVTGADANRILWHTGLISCAAFSPDGREVVTAGNDNTARVWAVATGRPITPVLRHKGEVLRAAFSPDGRLVVTASWDHTAQIWNAVSGKELGPALQSACKVWDARFSPDGRRVVTAAGENGKPGEVRVWDTATGRPLTPRMLHSGPALIALFSLDGKRIISGASTDRADNFFSYFGKGELGFWDAATGRPLRPVVRLPAPANSLALSPDGKWVAVAGSVGTSGPCAARVYNSATGRPVSAPMLHGDNVYSIDFSPEGRRVVTASADNTARVWDAATGRPLSPALRHGGAVTCARFDSSGRRVVSASLDGTARVWDAATGESLTPPLNHNSRLLSAAFSPDGRRILTASEDGTGRMWTFEVDSRPLVDVQRLVQLLAAQRLDPHADSVPLEQAERRADWAALSPKYASSFRATDAEFEGWKRRALALRPADYWFRRGDDYFRTGQWAQAIKYYSEFLELGGTPDWQVNQASDRRIEAYFKLGRGKAALADMSARIKGNPEDPLGWLNRAKVFAEMGRWDEAEADTSKALRLDPKNPDLWQRTADTEQSHGRYTQAIPYYSRAIELQRGFWAWFWRANCYLNLGQLDKAIADMSQAIELQPENMDAWCDRGIAYALTQHWDLAIKDYSKAIDLAPRYPSLWLTLAYAQAGSGDLVGYRKTCEKIIVRFVGVTSPVQVNNACWAVVILPNAIAHYAEPIRRMEKVILAAPRDSISVNTLGCLLYRAGRYDEAIKRLNESIALQNGNGGAEDFLFLAMAHQQLGHKPEARAWLDRATSRMSANSPSAASAAASWTGRLELQLFRREAEALIHPSNH